MDLNINRLNDIKSCGSDYSYSNHETKNFDVSWQAKNSSSNSIFYSSQIQQAFTYTSPNELSNYPYFGIFSYYLSGGYVYNLNLSNQYDFETDSNDLIIKDLDTLRALGWIDQYTRSIYIEFTTFNPNVNLFAYNTVLFEFLSTGTILKSAKFNPLLVYSKDNSYSIFILVINIIYLFYIAVNMVISLIELVKNGFRKYFSKLINFIQWIVYAFSITSFALFLCKLYETYSLLDKLKSSKNKNGNYLINFQMLNYWNDLLVITLGITTFFSILKFLDYMKFRKISKFIDVLRLSFNSLFQFSVIFLVVFVGFAQLFYIVFNARYTFFSTLAASLETCFLIILGISPKELLANDQIGQIIYFFFNLIISIGLVCFVIIIISESYAIIKRNENAVSEAQDQFLLDKLLQKLAEKFYIVFSRKKALFEQEHYSKVEYKDIVSTFQDHAQTLIDKIEANIN